MAGPILRWFGFVFLAGTGLASLANGYEPTPAIVAFGVGFVFLGALWPRGDLPPGLTVEASSRATRIPTIDLREVGHDGR